MGSSAGQRGVKKQNSRSVLLRTFGGSLHQNWRRLHNVLIVKLQRRRESLYLPDWRLWRLMRAKWLEMARQILLSQREQRQAAQT